MECPTGDDRLSARLAVGRSGKETVVFAPIRWIDARALGGAVYLFNVSRSLCATAR